MCTKLDIYLVIVEFVSKLCSIVEHIHCLYSLYSRLTLSCHVLLCKSKSTKQKETIYIIIPHRYKSVCDQKTSHVRKTKLHVSIDRVLRGNKYHVSHYRLPPWQLSTSQLHRLNNMLNQFQKMFCCVCNFCIINNLWPLLQGDMKLCLPSDVIFLFG